MLILYPWQIATAINQNKFKACDSKFYQEIFLQNNYLFLKDGEYHSIKSGVDKNNFPINHIEKKQKKENIIKEYIKKSHNKDLNNFPMFYSNTNTPSLPYKSCEKTYSTLLNTLSEYIIIDNIIINGKSDAYFLQNDSETFINDDDKYEQDKDNFYTIDDIKTHIITKYNLSTNINEIDIIDKIQLEIYVRLYKTDHFLILQRNKDNEHKILKYNKNDILWNQINEGLKYFYENFIVFLKLKNEIYEK